MHHRFRIVVIALASGATFASAAPAADWPQWRGPARDGVVAEPSGAPAGWPPVRLWERNVGKGCSSPILVGGRMYVMGWHGRGSTGTDTLFCLDAATGKELWRQSYACRYQGRLSTGDEGAYGGPSSTPTFDPRTGLLYTLSVDGDLRCWDTQQAGKGVWSMNFHEGFRIRQRTGVGGGTRDYGHTSSPLIYGELLVVEVGAEEGTVMAFDKRTGRRRWSSELKGPAGHTAGPVPARIGGADCVLNLLIDGLVVMRIDPGHEGRTVARYPRKTEFACNIPTPAAVDGQVLLTSEYNQSNSVLLDVTLGGVRQKWQSRSHALVCTPVIRGGRVYLVNGPLQCLDLATGQRLWRGGNFGHGSCVVTSDGKVIVWGNGKLALVEAGRSAYTEIGRVEGLCRGTCYPHVAFSDGLIACKDREGHTVVVSVRASDRSAVAKTHRAEPPQAPAAPKPAPRPSSPPKPRSETDKLHDAPAPTMAGAWPGNRDAAVFLWETAKSANRYADAAGKDALICRVTPRGRAKFDAAGRMDVGDGAMLAEGADEALLDACRQSHQLAIEALIAPASGSQSGPARIVSFSTDGYHRNFTIAQEGDELIFRLRTPRTGENGMTPQTTLCRVAAGKAVHLLASYSPGRLCCYLDGKRVIDTDRVQGDLGNWSAQHLLFGDEYQDRRDWRGTLSHVAVHSRVIGGAEAVARYRLAVPDAPAGP